MFMKHCPLKMRSDQVTICMNIKSGVGFFIHIGSVLFLMSVLLFYALSNAPRSKQIVYYIHIYIYDLQEVASSQVLYLEEEASSMFEEASCVS